MVKKNPRHTDFKWRIYFKKYLMLSLVFQKQKLYVEIILFLTLYALKIAAFVSY